MAYVIAAPCTKDTACVEVCPVDCIHPTKAESGFADAPQLYVDPDVCIDCGACEPVCPQSTIFPEDMVPADFRDAPARNAAYFRDQHQAQPPVQTPTP